MNVRKKTKTKNNRLDYNSKAIVGMPVFESEGGGEQVAVWSFDIR